MAASIKQHTGVEPQLIEGRGGVFDVVVNGELIFSKHDVDRFPEDDEILSQLSGDA